MNAHTPVPVDFNDNLANRCFPHKYRRIGTPYDYLDDIGIGPIVEYIYKGHMIIDVAEATNVPLATLLKWADSRKHGEQLHEAERKSAEGYLAEGQRRLRTAKTDFDLKKAKEMIRHAEFMAEKKDRGTYGNQKEGKKAPRTTYVFNIGAAPDPKAVSFAGRIIDAAGNTPKQVEQVVVAPDKVQLRLPQQATQRPQPPVVQEAAQVEPLIALKDSDIPQTLGEAFSHLLDDDTADTPLPPVTTFAPVIPTPDAPDIGPFYDVETTP